TDLGPVGVAICLDCFHDDVAASLARGGAKILVQPSANPAPWTKEQEVEWQESAYRRAFVQKLFPYAVNPMMTGRVMDGECFGRSSIVGQGGDLSRPPAPDAEEICVVKARHPCDYLAKALLGEGDQRLPGGPVHVGVVRLGDEEVWPQAPCLDAL